MHTLQYIHSRLSNQATTCDIVREPSNSYDGEQTSVGTVDVTIHAPTSSSQVVVEGADENTSLSGLVTPPETGDLDIQVGDTLIPQTDTSKRYRIETIDGHPTDLDPDIYELGLSRANASDV